MGGSWSESRPAWTETNYIWQRLRTENKKGEISYSEPSCVQGNTGAKGDKGEQGISVSNITNFYKASDKSTGIVAPQSSGGRNLYYLYNFNALNLANVSSHSVDNGEISLTASGSDLYIGEVLPINGKWDEMFSPLIKVDGAKTVTYTVTNKLFTANYYNFLNKDKRAIAGYTYVNKSSDTLIVPTDAVYLSMRFGYGNATKNTVYKLRIKVELGSKATDWTPAPEDYGWSTTPPQLTATNKYMWNYSMISGSSNEVLSYTPATMIGVYGDKGVDGKGVKSAEITYQTWMDGTTTPSGTWVTTVPDTTADKPYLWTRTIITYTDNSTSTSYSVGSTLKGVNVGGRNLYYLYDFNALRLVDVSSYSINNGEISLTASGPDMYIGEVLNIGDPWEKYRSPLMEVKGAKTVTYTVTNKLFTKNFYNFLDKDKKAIAGYTYVNKSSDTLIVPTDAVYLSMRFGYNNATINTVYELRIKVELGNIATDWTPAPEDVDEGINNAQSSADKANTNASNAQNTANNAKDAANKADAKADQAISGAASASTAAQIAKKQADAAQAKSDEANRIANGAAATISPIAQVVKVDSQGLKILNSEKETSYAQMQSTGLYVFVNKEQRSVFGVTSKTENLAVQDYLMFGAHRAEMKIEDGVEGTALFHVGDIK